MTLNLSFLDCELDSEFEPLFTFNSTFMDIISLLIQVGQLSVTSESLNTLNIGSLLKTHVVG